ncbi:MAG TPA: S8 family serine peptidase [Chloroflexia bacterium]|nr:S8 family serine peptidase [Chloroflexia bacterium]
MKRLSHRPVRDPAITYLLLFILVLNLVLTTPLTSSAAVPPGSEPPVKVTNSSKIAPHTPVPADELKKHPKGPTTVMIELPDEPAVKAYAALQASGQNPGRSALTSVTRQQISRLQVAQQSVSNALSSAGIKTREIYRVQRAYNGIAAIVDGQDIAKIEKLPGVKAVHVMTPKTLSNASSVPLIDAPQAWSNPTPITGQNMKIGIIDTGIDYIHTDFGGPGTGYDTNNNTGLTGTIFPTAKVAGGYDLAGDNYDGSNAPEPDPNPMDCQGHGSHVAGTAAGLGVNKDGTTYTGAYNKDLNFSNIFSIGPGVAPGAKLYAFRVFGCSGNTNLVTEALDYALDPNNDGDMSDHMDVVNMSLGADFQPSDDPDSVASDNASLGGIIVVNAAGNAGDTYYIAGSPGNSTRSLSVAASADSTAIMDGFRVNNPSSIAGVYVASRSGNYPWENPALATVQVPVTSTVFYPYNAADPLYSTGCEAFTAADAQTIQGKIVLVDWVQAGGSTFPCGSKTRTDRVQSAGGVGIIIADSVDTFSTSIAGNSAIPAIFVQKSTGDKLKSQLDASNLSTYTVTLSNEYDDTTPYKNDALTDTVADFSSRGPASHSNGLKPDITAPGVTIFSAHALTGNKGESLNGTSMATPHMAGTMALLKELHPTWTVEQLKALAMNTAGHDIWTDTSHTATEAPTRVGAGRVDVKQAIDDTVIAYNNDGSGAVSVSFGDVEAQQVTTLTKSVVVHNFGNSSASYTLSYRADETVPGVTYSFPNGTNLTVGAGASVTFPVQVVIDPAQLKHTRDNNVPDTQLGNPRSWLTEATGLILLTPASGTSLRLPVYVAPRPASSMSGRQSDLIFNSATGTANLALTGQGINTGSSYPTDTLSLVSAVEWQGTNPRNSNPAVGNANVQYYGVSSDYKSTIAASQPVTSSVVFFGLSTYGKMSMPSFHDAEFDIHISLSTSGAFTDDFVVYNSRYKDVNGTNTDTFLTVAVDNSSGAGYYEYFTNLFTPGQYDTALFNTGVLLLPVQAGDIGLTAGNTKFRYYINSFSSTIGGQLVDSTSTSIKTYDIANPGLDFTGAGNLITGEPVFSDMPSNTIPVTFNQANFNANGSQGVLLLHHFNTIGNQAQALAVGGAGAGCASDTQVTRTDDDALCGSLRHAMTFAGTGGLPSTVQFTLNAPATISVASALPAMGSITLDGGAANCSANGPTIVIDGRINGVGIPENGLVVNGSANIYNLKVKGFGGKQLAIAPPGNAKFKCAVFSKS